MKPSRNASARGGRPAGSGRGALGGFPAAVPVLLLAFLPLRCGLFFLPDYDGIHLHPEDQYAVLADGEFVNIGFDFEPDRYSVEQIFTVRDARGAVAGRHLWEEDRVSFVPETGYQPGKRYSLVFRGKFRDGKGNPYQVDHEILFTIGGWEHRPPEFLGSSPPDGSVIGGIEPVVLEFSTAMNPLSFRDRVSVSPETGVGFEWNAERTMVTVRPEDRWRNLTLYGISLDENLESTDGSTIGESVRLSFFVESDTTAPQVDAAGPAEQRWLPLPAFPLRSGNLTDIRSRDAIRITFSEPMNPETVRTAFRLEPPLAGDLFWIDNPSEEHPLRQDLVFAPAEGYSPEISYVLTIGTGAEDRAGNGLFPPFTSRFVPAVPVLRLERIRGVSGSPFVLGPDDYSTVIAQPLRGGPSSPFEYTFRFTFSEPFVTESAKLKVQEALRFTELLGDGGSPSAAFFHWNTDFELTASFGNFRAESGREHYYLLEIPGGRYGLVNDDGSRLSQSIRQLFEGLLP